MTPTTIAPRPLKLAPHPPALAWIEAVVALVLLMVLGGFLALAPLAWGVLLIVGAAGGVLLLRNPTLGLYALAIAVPFGSLRTLNMGGLTASAAQVMLAAFLGAWVLQALAYRDLRVGRSRLTLALVAWVGVMALSLLRAQALPAALSELLKWVQVTILFLYVAGRVSWGERRWLVLFLLLGGLAQGALGIYQFLARIGPPGFLLMGQYMRAHGTFGQPNPYGGYLGLILPLAYAYALTHWRVWLWPVGRLSLADRLLWPLAVGATAVMAAALIMSWSRGALLGFIAGAALVTLALARRIWPALLVVGLVLLVTLPLWQTQVPISYLARLDNTTAYLGQDLALVEIDDDNFAIVERLAHWDAAWQMFSRRPWLGVGIGQYAVEYPAVALPRWQDPLGHAHNYYLHTLAETGLLGLAAYLIVLLSALALAWRRARSFGLWPRALGLGALGMLGHLMGHSLVDNLYVQEIYLLIAIILGMLVAPLFRSPCSEQAVLAPQPTIRSCADES